MKVLEIKSKQEWDSIMQKNNWIADCNIPFDCRIKNKETNELLAYLDFAGKNIKYNEEVDKEYVVCENANELALSVAKYCMNNKIWDLDYGN